MNVDFIVVIFLFIIYVILRILGSRRGKWMLYQKGMRKCNIFFCEQVLYIFVCKVKIKI